MRGNTHVRFGGRPGETDQSGGWHCAPGRPHYWAADVLADMGANVHLAHPLGNNWGNRRVKNDERDAADLVDLLRLGRLAEAHIAPPGLRELRELVRHRALCGSLHKARYAEDRIMPRTRIAVWS